MMSDLAQRLTEITARFSKLRSIFDLDGRNERVAELEAAMGEPSFWDNTGKARAVTQDLSKEKSWITESASTAKSLRDAAELIELAQDAADESLEREIALLIDAAAGRVEELERRSLLSDEDDIRSAIVTIHPGAGGTDAQDWAEMLLRMYTRWAEKKGFATETLDILAGEEAGIKSATFEVSGPYAFGYLKGEAGVHRLVRISPFDANHRRHTAFASVHVLPEHDDDIQVEIKDGDLRVDTFRASGAGGQHVNKTSSAIRVTHIPTGIVVQCQSERSQHRNRDSAMKVLNARLYDYYKKIDDAKKAEKEFEKKDIDFGSGDRSYVFQPYTQVKDKRTGAQTSDVQGVIDGDIDAFVDAFLRKKLSGHKSPRG
ncbi:MAG: peptide chain release factor 2 [bacterium]